MMRGCLWVLAAVLCMGCGNNVSLGGGPNGGSDAGSGASGGASSGTGGTTGMDAGSSGSPGMDAGVAGNSGMDAGVGGCTATVVAESAFPTQYWGLAVDADAVYWFSFDSTGDQLTWIDFAMKPGGKPQHLAAVGQAAEWLTSKYGNIFYAATGTGVDQGSIGRVDLATAKFSPIVSGVMAHGVAVNMTTAFFTADHPGATPAGSELDMVSSGGGKVTTLSSVSLSAPFADPAGPILDGNDVYWIKPGKPSSLEQINPILAMPPVTVASGDFIGGTQTLAIDNGKLFYLENNGTAALNGGVDVKTVSTSGGQSKTVAKNTNAGAVVADGGEVFWRNGGTHVSGDPGFYKDDGSIQKAPATGGAPVTLVSGLTGGQSPGVLAIAVDATYLYWVEDNHTSGYRVMRTCR